VRQSSLFSGTSRRIVTDLNEHTLLIWWPVLQWDGPKSLCYIEAVKSTVTKLNLSNEVELLMLCTLKLWLRR